MKNKIFLLMFIILSVFSLSACSCQKSTYPPEDCLCIEFESQYKLDADIKFNISVGLQNGYQEKFGNIEGSKYIIAYSKNENIANNTEIKNLLIINDFSSDMYCYTKNKDKINFNFCKQFIIDKEFFNDGDMFYICMYYTTSEENSDKKNISFSIKYKITYEKVEDYLILRIAN